MTKITSLTGWISGASLLFALASPALSQENATETAKKAAETAFKNPALQDMLKKVKDDPDAALKDVSKLAKEQMNKVGGVPSANEVPATRAEVTNPGLPTVSVPSRPVPAAPAPVPAPAPATSSSPPPAVGNQMQIPEPVARGERPVPAPKTEVREPTLAPLPGLPVAPEAVPAPRPLKQKYVEKAASPDAPKRAAGADQMDITADASVMDEKNSILTFTGNVVVQHPGFNLTGDKLVIYMNEAAPDGQAAAADAPPFKKAVATGGMVKITRPGADGKPQIANARKADYDAASGDIVLSGGPPTLQNGDVFVNPNSPQALIVLKGNGQHEVKGGGGRVGFSMPIKGGGKATGGLPGGSLDSIKKDR